ncbi:hypothetical protein COW81_02945 [Candidatus Campbellbacteria bacterium CG22_combo_CG10-13_8_21_14_all_36_13]|uniref:UPF0102 protein COW81_02945 n=1 Tax=Candidatus Campbellbacteria bacterium CG22_combo_CG10-13_8_21_14_all_36_13 TaxID=1974529 RepID=A0A2H0DXM4_9BACT|nr:MAG: hypothetical protein COW81_02945 [Candidatus Campbellbacteria bacterium CG22_combo_CG10-13_8_21_14_all_36_13]
MDFKNKKSNHHYIGALGEEIAVMYLEGRGYKTITRNYRQKWGEIDAVMKKKDKIHFVEVKSVSARVVNGERGREKDKYNPADNMHPFKIKRIYRAIESFLGESRNSPPAGGRKELDWQIDLVSVYIDKENQKAKVEFLENIF